MRSANKTTEVKSPGVVLKWKPDEFTVLKLNVPGPSGTMGGYQKMENILIQLTDKVTLECYLKPEYVERIIRYINSYGVGGPNGRIRKACLPPLRRLGILLTSDERK
jgi:hypothetical protein